MENKIDMTIDVSIREIAARREIAKISPQIEPVNFWAWMFFTAGLALPFLLTSCIGERERTIKRIRAKYGVSGSSQPWYIKTILVIAYLWILWSIYS